jgi:hypothetical protein
MEGFWNTVLFLVLGILFLYFFKAFKKIGPFEWENKYAPANAVIRIYTFLVFSILCFIGSVLYLLDFLNVITLPYK